MRPRKLRSIHTQDSKQISIAPVGGGMSATHNITTAGEGNDTGFIGNVNIIGMAAGATMSYPNATGGIPSSYGSGIYLDGVLSGQIVVCGTFSETPEFTYVHGGNTYIGTLGASGLQMSLQ